MLCNNKSIDLFGYDFSEEASYCEVPSLLDKQLNQPVFIPLDQVKDPAEIFNKIKKQRKAGIDTLIRVSLNEIIVKARSASRDPNKFQTYIKYDAAMSSSLDGHEDSGDKPQPDLGDMFIVKVLDLTFNDKECMLINFIDITMYQRLQFEE